MPHLDAATIQLLRAQDNVIADWQVPTMRRAMQRARASGVWTRVTPRVYLAAPCRPTERQRLWAAVLHCGPTACLAGRSALFAEGWRGTLQWPLQVITSESTRVHRRPAWIQVHRSRLQIPQQVSGIPRVNATPAVVQAGGWARTPREAMFVVLSSLQQEVTKPKRLRQELLGRPQAARRALLLELVDEYSSGVSSLNEHEFAQICRKHGLPQPIRQSRRKDSKGRDRYIDAEFQAHDGRIIMVEIDGMQHLDPENWTEDTERQNSLVLRTGGLVLRVSTFMLRHSPESFVNDLREAIAGTSDAAGQPVTRSDQSPAA